MKTVKKMNELYQIGNIVLKIYNLIVVDRDQLFQILYIPQKILFLNDKKGQIILTNEVHKICHSGKKIVDLEPKLQKCY